MLNKIFKYIVKRVIKFDPILHCKNYNKCCATDTWMCPCEKIKPGRF